MPENKIPKYYYRINTITCMKCMKRFSYKAKVHQKTNNVVATRSVCDDCKRKNERDRIKNKATK